MTHLRNMPSGEIGRFGAGSVPPADSAWRPVLALDGWTQNPTAYARFKLVAEWIGALLLLIAAAPLVAVLAVIIKATSTGPVFYSQLRLGRSGRRFRIYKLRTMLHQCEAATGPVWSVADDPRVTAVGRWLRDSHLDELPQLLNVIRGDMALIGPRPERPELAARIERTVPDFADRLLVRPGITGLAQMRMPSDTDLQAVPQKLAHDLDYIRDMGLALDARICLSTVFFFVRAVASIALTQIMQPRVRTRMKEWSSTESAPEISLVRRQHRNMRVFDSIDDVAAIPLSNAA